MKNISSIFFQKRHFFAWMVLVAGILIGIISSLVVKNILEKHTVGDFIYSVDKFALKLHDRIDTYELILRGGAGLFATSDEVSRKDWQAYVETLELDRGFVEVQGVGFAKVIHPSQLESHIAEVRSEGFLAYEVHPLGERPFYTSIIYLEPFRDRNLRAFGYDMYSEPIRRFAMEQACDSGQVALSGKVELVQETSTDVQAGFLLYVPVYDKTMPKNTLEERRASLIGWVYSPYRMKDFMFGIDRDWDDGSKIEVMSINIYDGTQAQPSSLLFSNTLNPISVTHSLFYQERILDFNGKKWFLVFDSPLSGENINYMPVWATLIGSFVLSLLLFGLLIAIRMTQSKAEQIAGELTKELEESRFRWKFAIEGSGSGAWDWDMERKKVFFSSHWKDMLGYAQNEIGDALEEWEKRIHPKDKPTTLQALQDYFNGKTELYVNEHRILCKNGSYKWVLDRGIIVRYSDEGKPLRMIGTHTDIDDYKTLENEMRMMNELLDSQVEQEVAQRMKIQKEQEIEREFIVQNAKLASMGEMLGAIAHQWRQPLNAINMTIQNLDDDFDEGLVDKAFIDKFIAKNKQTIEFMSKTIDSFRDFFRIDKTKQDFSIQEAIHETITILSAQMKNNDIEIVMQGEDTSIHSFRSEFQQVILNLINNSKDALIEKKIDHAKISIQLFPTGLSIEDNAGGIKEEILNRIFEPYFTTKEQGKGTGIGLYMSKMIVEKNMGGVLSVKNTPRGASFCIMFDEASLLK